MSKNILDDIFDPNRIVLYKCPKGHVISIPFSKGQQKPVYCDKCAEEEKHKGDN